MPGGCVHVYSVLCEAKVYFYNFTFFIIFVQNETNFFVYYKFFWINSYLEPDSIDLGVQRYYRTFKPEYLNFKANISSLTKFLKFSNFSLEQVDFQIPIASTLQKEKKIFILEMKINLVFRKVLSDLNKISDFLIFNPIRPKYNLQFKF